MVVLNSIGVDTYSNTYVTGELVSRPRNWPQKFMTTRSRSWLGSALKIQSRARQQAPAQKYADPRVAPRSSQH